VEDLVMPERSFYILDVFAEKKYAGNQLAVIRDAEGLSDEEMQKIAKEMNYSETTFVMKDEERDGGYDVRIFTPDTEVPFAGHPTLGTAYIIQHEIIKEPVPEVSLNLKVGQIPVSFKYTENEPEVLWMRQNPPAFGQSFDPKQISEILGLKEVEIDNRFPIMEVSTGLSFIIVPLNHLESVKRTQVKLGKLFEFIEDKDSKAVLIFCPEPINEKNQLHARVFAHYYGVPEDPATGSANGCLTAYLVKNKYFGDSKVDVRVEQGCEVNRPSLLLLRGDEKDGKIEVNVGGRVILTAEGTLK
jgi:trans-2,3-dihydro-3-hydroxyanthranilate isomerase